MECSTMPATVSRVAGLGVIRGGSTRIATIRSDGLRSIASRAAHSTARRDSCEPSVPAITGFVAMALLPAAAIALLFTQPRRGGGRTLLPFAPKPAWTGPPRARDQRPAIPGRMTLQAWIGWEHPSDVTPAAPDQGRRQGCREA